MKKINKGYIKNMWVSQIIAINCKKIWLITYLKEHEQHNSKP